MTRTTARIKHDEVVRMVKAVQNCGLSVSRVSYDGNRVDVIIGEKEVLKLDPPPEPVGPSWEPEL